MVEKQGYVDSKAIAIATSQAKQWAARPKARETAHQGNTDVVVHGADGKFRDRISL